jgi:hypothetical protein
VTWDENKELIRGLWPNAAIEPALAELFAERLSGLDQGVLREAVKDARVASRFHTPELGEILGCYHKSKRLSSRSWQPPAREKPPTPTPGVDPEEERRTVEDIRILRSEVEHTVEAVEELIERILDAMIANRIGSVMTHRMLIPLQALRFHLMGKVVKPAAMAEAEKVWPGITSPEATEEPLPGDHLLTGVMGREIEYAF